LLAAADGWFGVQIWNLRELRAELARLGLDWDHPPLPMAGESDSTPIAVRIVEVGSEVTTPLPPE
jgi:hypothetical protein